MNKFDEFKNTLTAMKDKLTPILGSDTDKFVQIAINYVEQNKSLLEKDVNSLYKAIFDAAQAGLYIDARESALVPFKGKVKFMSMYQGLLKQVRNSGELASINCGVAYEKDIFEFYTDEKGEHLKHVPDYKAGKDRGKPIVTYAIARIKDGQAPYIEIMMEEEIQDCKKSSRAGSDSPWNGLFANEMRKKTVLRRISKRLPSSTDLNAAIHADDELFIPQDEPEKEEEKPTTSSKLQEAVKPELTGVECIVDNLSQQEVKKGGETVHKYSTEINGDEYLTFDSSILEKLKKARSQKNKVVIMYDIKTKKSGATYNEITDVIFKEAFNIAEQEDVPI
jgi:recombination protein RecT